MTRFTKHALEKFEILKKHGFYVSKRAVIQAVELPDSLDYSRYPLKIAQTDFDKRRVLRVVYKEMGRIKLVITFYPGRKTQYEKKR